MIKHWDIECTLRQTHHLMPIRIQTREGTKIVYLTKVLKNIWGRAQHDQQDTLLFPTKSITILKIGSENVQTKQEAQAEKKEYYSIMRQLACEKRKKERTLILKGAYIRHLKDPNN